MTKVATLPESAASLPQAAAARPRRLATIRLGYVPLLDAAPLIVAETLGYFERAGLRVCLSEELGWGSVREKIVYGELDAAHAPGGLLFSILFGTHTPPCGVRADLVLNLQGNGITLSHRLWQKGVRDGQTLKLMIRCETPRRPVFAVVSPFASDYFLMRKWLRLSGIDPDRDVRIAALPPTLVGEHMAAGQIDGFCVGAPWNSAVALARQGWVVATSESLEPLHPEKVLITRPELYRERADEYAALRFALVEACRFCDVPENRKKVVDLLHARNFFPCDREALANALSGPFDTGVGKLELRNPFVIFHRNRANEVTRERAQWFLETVLEAGVLSLDARQRRLGLEAFQESSTTNPT